MVCLEHDSLLSFTIAVLRFFDHIGRLTPVLCLLRRLQNGDRLLNGVGHFVHMWYGSNLLTPVLQDEKQLRKGGHITIYIHPNSS